MIKKFNATALVILCMSTGHADWHDRKAEGWAWYEDQKPPTKTQQPASYKDYMQKERSHLEEQLAKAIFYPIPENVQAYLELQKKWIERITQFSQVWAQVILNHPHLDNTFTCPVSQYGQEIHREILRTKKEEFITEVAKEHGLFLFYSGADPRSPACGRVAEYVAQKYGWTLMTISTDGVEIDGFSKPKNDNGIAKTLAIEATPAIYLINPDMKSATPIAFGTASVEQIEDNILRQLGEVKGD